MNLCELEELMRNFQKIKGKNFFQEKEIFLSEIL